MMATVETKMAKFVRALRDMPRDEQRKLLADICDNMIENTKNGTSSPVCWSRNSIGAMLSN